MHMACLHRNMYTVQWCCRAVLSQNNNYSNFRVYMKYFMLNYRALSVCVVPFS